MIKKMGIRTITTVSWRFSRKRLSRGLHRFSQVEADSAWQILHALNAADDPSHKAKLFTNALEEIRHAELFSRLARHYSEFPLPLDTPRRKQLYDPNTGLTDFEVNLFLGEAAVHDQFLSYANASPLQRIREVFLSVREDEADHRSSAYAELARLAAGEARARRLIRRSRMKQLYHAWLRFGEAIGNFVFSLLLSVIYFLSAPIFGWLCRRRMEGLGAQILRGPAEDEHLELTQVGSKV